MTRRLKTIMIGAAAAAALAGGAVAVAASGSEAGSAGRGASGAAPGWSIDPGRDRAAAAALGALGGGTVTEVERADDGQSGYEVEVDRPDGTSVEVNVRPDLSVGQITADD